MRIAGRTRDGMLLWRLPKLLVVLLVGMGCLCLFGSAGAECIDYGAHLHWVGSVSTPSFAIDCEVSGTHAFIASYEAGLQVIDVTNPENPQIVGSVDTPGHARGVALSGTTAYVADGYSGLQVIDITNPEFPQLAGSVELPDLAEDVAVSGTHVFVTVYSAGLQVVDIADPVSPRIVGSVNTPHQARGVAVSSTHVYVADGDSGLQILPAQCEPSGVAGHDGLPSMHLRVLPNPSSWPAVIRFQTRGRGAAYVAVYDPAGRLVRRLFNGIPNADGHDLLWDGRTKEGAAVAAGVYFVRVSTAEERKTARFVLVR